MSYQFYYLGSDSKLEKKLTVDDVCRCRLWRPTWGSIVPAGVAVIPFAAWWALHHLRLFKNRDYGLFLIYKENRLIHRSGVFPGYFRFPFMETDDLQIGDTWTDPEHRGRGIASFAIQEIVALCRRPGRGFWYITEQNNFPSIRAAMKVGFVKVGDGERVAKLGLRVLGSYLIRTR